MMKTLSMTAVLVGSLIASAGLPADAAKKKPAMLHVSASAYDCARLKDMVEHMSSHDDRDAMKRILMCTSK